MQLWHPTAASGSLMYPATAPHGSAHSVSHLAARHALSAETVAVAPTEMSIVHCDRHFESPLQAPRHDSYGEHTGSVEQAVDSAQQFVLAHEAHRLVPYG